MNRSAIISECGAYRYRLERWGWVPESPARGSVAFIMLNPSTADADIDDPTIRRCIRYAQDWGYAKLIVGNLFALRATDPRELRKHRDPAGPGNHRALTQIVRDAQQVVCAWGNHGFWHQAGRRFITSVKDGMDRQTFYLRLSKEGHPAHPLYLPASLKPQHWGTATPEGAP